jgi:hypothetical protein
MNRVVEERKEKHLQCNRKVKIGLSWQSGAGRQLKIVEIRSLVKTGITTEGGKLFELAGQFEGSWVR